MDIASFHDLMLRLHVGFGLLALVTFWWQMPTRKRGPRHRRVGQAYFLAMAGVVATAVPLTVLLSTDGRWANALFLGFLAWITAAAGIAAWMAARWRQRRMAVQRRFHVVAHVGLLVVSLAMLVLFRVGGALFVGLGAFGAWSAVVELRRAAADPVWRSWQVRHVGHVIGTGMAVHVAFFSFGINRMLADGFNAYFFLFAFAVPVLLGNWAIARFTRRYRETLAAAPPAGPAPGRGPVAAPGSAAGGSGVTV